MSRAGSVCLGLSPAGNPLRDCRTFLKLSQRRMRKWGYLSTSSHLSLFEGYSQPGHQLCSTVGCPVRNGHAPVAGESPQVAILGCLRHKAKDLSGNCAEVTSKVVRQDVVGHIVCYPDHLHEYQYLHGMTCQLCDDFLYTISFNIVINMVSINVSDLLSKLRLQGVK